MKKIISFCLALCATTALWAGTSNFRPAAFSVAEGTQIAFSQGNLQYTKSIDAWMLAENQYDMIGEDNVSDEALADKIDLFGWSGSTGSAKWGISTSPYYEDYAGDFVDWGQNIGAGTTYRTPTKSEWDYLLNTRDNAESKKGVARINLNSDGSQYANGLILLPDSWDCPEGVTFKSGFADSEGVDDYATYQTFTLDQWQKLEAAGAVFLPASGDRIGSDMYGVQDHGAYWSASPFSSNYTYYLYFVSNRLRADYGSHSSSFAVRLVRDVHVNIAAVTNGTVEVDNLGATEGEMVTITVTPAEGYEVESITVTYGDGQKVEVSEENTFVMPAGEVTITVVFKESGTAIETIEIIDLRTENGSVIYDGEFQIFDLLGRNVTRLNGSLNGVYIVKVGDKAQKVVVSRK